MKPTSSRKPKQDESWPRKVQPGREAVTVYRRKTPSGNFAYLVSNYAGGNRRLDAYSIAQDALDAADKLARQIDRRDYVAATMTQAQAIEYAGAVEALSRYDVTVGAGAGALAECLKIVGDLSNVHAACKFYVERRKQVTKKPIARVAVELLKIKKSRGASARYYRDLRLRLKRFLQGCKKDCCNVTTADVQAWLDSQKAGKNPLSPQSYKNYRTILHTLFEFAVARGYAADNPVESVEKLKVRNGDVEIFTPVELARLLEAARVNYPNYLPCLAIGAFAGLRSAELERLTWQDIDLTARHIIVSAGNSKTASRRIVPIADNLAEWLQPYAGRQGKIWKDTPDMFYKTQGFTADATAVEANEEKGIKAQKPVVWKQNGLRHSFASYKFALTNNAGELAGMMGNSAAMIFKHYRELVKPADAQRWFAVKPAETPANVLTMPATASN